MHSMRCSRGAHGCGRRFRLKRHPDSYKRSPRCPHCGSRIVMDVEAQRRRDVARQATCYCSAYPFPHREGSLVACAAACEDVAHLNAEQRRDWEATCRTRRGAPCRASARPSILVGLGVRRTVSGADDPPF